MATMRTGWGRHIYGLASILLGVCTLIWRDFFWQMAPPVKFSNAGIFVDCIAVVQIFGGVAVQFPRLARSGAVALSLVYAVLSLVWLPPWIRKPQVFDALGNAFEYFAMLAGALMIYGRGVARFGYYGFSLSVISFAVYQYVHLDFTATLVPKWIPPGQMFWAYFTTIAFALAGLALLTGMWARLAAQLTTLMLFLFGLLIWVPATISKPGNHGNWSELGINYGICGAAWITAEFLATARRRR